MALEDFDTHDSTEAQVSQPASAPMPAAAPAPAPARKPVASEDEDLFDFPIVEMKLETEAVKKPAAPAPAVKPPAPAPVAKAPAAPPAPKAPAPAPAPAPLAEAKSPSRAIAQAAQLVQDIQQVLSTPPEAPPSRSRLFGPAPFAIAGVALLVLTNVFGLYFLWNNQRSFQSGVQAMNEQLVETLRRQTQAAPTQLAQPVHSPAAANSAPAPLEAFELAALQLAREEIQAGEYAAARRRLSRLLAVADRIEAGEREEIEAQAAFLIASTYRKQAEAAREETP